MHSIEGDNDKEREREEGYSLSPVLDGSSVQSCFFFRLAPLAFSLKPKVSAVIYLCWPLIKPMVHQPFCWFCEMISPLLWFSSQLWPFMVLMGAMVTAVYSDCLDPAGKNVIDCVCLLCCKETRGIEIRERIILHMKNS